MKNVSCAAVELSPLFCAKVSIACFEFFTLLNRSILRIIVEICLDVNPRFFYCNDRRNGNYPNVF